MSPTASDATDIAASPLRRHGRASTASVSAMAFVAVGRSTQKQHLVSRMHMIAMFRKCEGHCGGGRSY